MLMLSWEYPPKSVGGLAQHVYDLTNALTENGVDVHLITSGGQGTPAFEKVHGVKVHRVEPYQISSPDFVTWVAQFNVALLERAISISSDLGEIHILHAHDWLVAYAARALKHSWKIPLVTTLHATEYGRNNGLHNDTQRHISDIEWWLAYESWRVICCSHYMEGELRHVFQIPQDKIKVIPNGVDHTNFKVRESDARRSDYAAPDERIVFYVGRLVREKGVQVLLDAAPEILAHHPQTKFVIAGKGPFMDSLKRQAMLSGIANRVYFTGYINDTVRNNLYSWADVAVFPSLYEPFGIVALEAMAARTPVVVADSGGLGEIINHGIDGLKTYTGDSHSLAQNILSVLKQPQFGDKLRENAYYRVLNEFNWGKIAWQTASVYREVLEAHQSTAWSAAGRQERIFNRFGRMLTRYS
ncbi:glycosyltransferase family 4 protein [Pelotomaculum isophthalicicum]|uniref:glycosyltransferase family 4 protein n=1 Tax=Pelotomaculum isophthalicicum TaxID=342448 RepID=UPI0030B832EC